MSKLDTTVTIGDTNDKSADDHLAAIDSRIESAKTVLAHHAFGNYERFKTAPYNLFTGIDSEVTGAYPSVDEIEMSEANGNITVTGGAVEVFVLHEWHVSVHPESPE